MEKCKKCCTEIAYGSRLTCPNCGADMCLDCATSTFRICPYCYYDLEYSG